MCPGSHRWGSPTGHRRNYPKDVAVDGADNRDVTAAQNHRVLKLAAATTAKAGIGFSAWAPRNCIVAASA
ncbi:hypothetical protein MMRN_p0880 (plasmid) [Mycobacterium marinum]|nr:hypothetical protein MMRN_p0880 [Mycobacterium marinum]GJO51759.1 hypothetical protein NJB1604_39900 [Mycobacterium marinum]